MKDSKLLTVLSDLSKWEILSFERFLHSPYFNEQEKLIRLFECLREDNQSNYRSGGFVQSCF